MLFDSQSLSELERRYRINLINSLSGYKSPHLVGTKAKCGLTNLAVFSNVFHLGADPALMGMIVRPDSVARHTLSNLKDTGFYTLNQVPVSIYQQGHQTAARYSESEFTAVGLSEHYIDDFWAPFVAESSVKIGLSFCEAKSIEQNGTILVIGEVINIEVLDKALLADGVINHAECEAVAVTGLDAYYNTSPLTRLSYAKPDKSLVKIPFE